jgi:myo-inositol-1(or 4)-monophosphatase
VGGEQAAPPALAVDLPAVERAMLDAAARAAAVIRAGAAGLRDIMWEHKGPADFVSHVDRGAEEAARDALLGAFPDAVFIGEETYDPSVVFGEGLAFVVDPLDGTTNFLHGFPWYAVSIGATVAGELAAGVVLNAVTGEVFTATRGGGAYRNGLRIHVSATTEPARALVGTGFPFKNVDRLDEYTRHFAAITRATSGIRRPGSAALDLCDVACGRFDAFWELTLSPWDIAAGILIIREAGGIVTDLDGNPAQVGHTPLAAGNPTMHRWLLQTIRDA